MEATVSVRAALDSMAVGRRRLEVFQRHFFQTWCLEQRDGKPFEVWSLEREAEMQAEIQELQRANAARRAAQRPALAAELRQQIRRR